eukprot:CAMPEP_0173291746 /NCGR_PEP_ID=MMETSP1143-20121109/12330_1 /TAXON_ID=483371 /ORGANISM="non described non described, Strain CCMP2298" /LENGTH=97 /DNA_ID=CAMNT_0014231029 /DNA_START=637 /DNA_END=927 /DNA_ORIENTATION=+
MCQKQEETCEPHPSPASTAGESWENLGDRRRLSECVSSSSAATAWAAAGSECTTKCSMRTRSLSSSREWRLCVSGRFCKYSSRSCARVRAALTYPAS